MRIGLSTIRKEPGEPLAEIENIPTLAQSDGAIVVVFHL
jgi:hypothetical protein